MKLNEDIFEIDVPQVDPSPELTIDEIEPETVATPVENGVATMLINSISDTWDKINDYNNIISTVSSSGIGNAEEIISVVKDVVDEENENVGKLMSALTSISPNTENVNYGIEQADMKLTEATAILPDGTTYTKPIKYNGYKIKFDPKDETFSVYDKYGELEDYGFTSIDKAKHYIDWEIDSPLNSNDNLTLREDFEDSKAELLSDILGRSISSTDENYIYDGWRAFYNNPESFRNSVVVDMVNKGLDTRPVNESKRKMRIKESLKEELRDATEDEYFDMMHDVYNALADVAFKYSKKGIEFTSNQWDDAYEWWGDRFFTADFDESLKEDIENLEDVDVEFNPVMQNAKDQSEQASKEIEKEMKDIEKDIPEWDSEEVIGAEKQEVPKKPVEPKATLDESLFTEAVKNYEYIDLGYIDRVKCSAKVYDDGSIWVSTHHPYDDADYHWAVSKDDGIGYKVYIHSPGKFVKSIIMGGYDDTDELIEQVKEVAKELISLDKSSKISKRMMYN